MDKLEGELTQLPPRTRVAFAAGCAQRVLPVYKYTVPGDVIFRGPSLAVNTAWSFAEGEEIDDNRLKQVRAELERAFPEPDLGGGANHFACSSAAYAADAIEDKTARSARLAAGRARDAIDQIDEEDGVEEEKRWQDQALQVVKSWGDKPIRRDMFDALTREKPGWLRRME
jgi:hypothetical protein